MTLLPEPDDPDDFIRRLAESEERPFADFCSYELLEFADLAEDDFLARLALFFEARMRVRKDPRSRAAAVIAKLLPALKAEAKFHFPDEPDALPGQGPFGQAVDWPQVGLLAHMGYHVGARDPGTRRRREILRRVFKGPIPDVVDSEYMAEWGRDGSLDRLRKLARSIASFANIRLMHIGDWVDAAVSTWADDLEWLRVTYYKGHFGFPWPALDL